MVRQDSQRSPPSRRFILSPNCSLEWREARIVLAAVAGVELAIGTGFFCLGLPLVLPFSGLEVLALVGAFYYCSRQAARREVVVIDDERIIVQRGRSEPAQIREFQRAWVRVVLDRQSGWYPSRLKLCSHGSELEIGEFLLEEERQAFARNLKDAVARGFDWAAQAVQPRSEETKQQ